MSEQHRNITGAHKAWKYFMFNREYWLIILWQRLGRQKTAMLRNKCKLFKATMHFVDVFFT